VLESCFETADPMVAFLAANAAAGIFCGTGEKRMLAAVKMFLGRPDMVVALQLKVFRTVFSLVLLRFSFDLF
jgi:hypothetical protein